MAEPRGISSARPRAEPLFSEWQRQLGRTSAIHYQYLSCEEGSLLAGEKDRYAADVTRRSDSPNWVHTQQIFVGLLRIRLSLDVSLAQVGINPAGSYGVAANTIDAQIDRHGSSVPVHPSLGSTIGGVMRIGA